MPTFAPSRTPRQGTDSPPGKPRTAAASASVFLMGNAQLRCIAQQQTRAAAERHIVTFSNPRSLSLPFCLPLFTGSHGKTSRPHASYSPNGTQTTSRSKTCPLSLPNHTHTRTMKLNKITRATVESSTHVSASYMQEVSSLVSITAWGLRDLTSSSDFQQGRTHVVLRPRQERAGGEGRHQPSTAKNTTKHEERATPCHTIGVSGTNQKPTVTLTQDVGATEETTVCDTPQLQNTFGAGRCSASDRAHLRATHCAREGTGDTASNHILHTTDGKDKEKKVGQRKRTNSFQHQQGHASHRTNRTTGPRAQKKSLRCFSPAANHTAQNQHT